MANFAEVGDVANFLQLEISTDVQLAACHRALVGATAAIKNYTKQEIERVEDDEITLDVQPHRTRLFLPELPVIEVSAVVEDEDELTVTDDWKLGQHGILHRAGGRCWAAGVQIVTVTYTHGYANIPDDIVDVCTRAAARVYQAGLKAAEAEGVPGVASKSLGDFSVSFAAEGGGGAGEGVLGASAARLLLMSEKEILDNYRVKRP